MCVCETKYQGGGIAPFLGAANLPEKVSCDTGYRSDSIALSRDMGPPSLTEEQHGPENATHQTINADSQERCVFGCVLSNECVFPQVSVMPLRCW